MTKTETKPKRRDRHEKLMDERIRLSQGKIDARAACDFLFYQLDLLIHEVEELKAAARMKL